MSNPQVEQTAPSIVYSVSDDGQVIRTDKDGAVHVATLKEGNVLVLLEAWEKLRPAIVRHLNANGKTPTAIYREGDEPEAKAKREIPPMPPKDWLMGDKTPAVVEWYRKYKPEEYRARYGILGNGTVTKYRKVPNARGELTTEAYETDAVISRRKTHLTEKSEANESGSIYDGSN
jgi:hypothetical protein